MWPVRQICSVPLEPAIPSHSRKTILCYILSNTWVTHFPMSPLGFHCLEDSSDKWALVLCVDLGCSSWLLVAMGLLSHTDLFFREESLSPSRLLQRLSLPLYRMLWWSSPGVFCHFLFGLFTLYCAIHGFLFIGLQSFVKCRLANHPCHSAACNFILYTGLYTELKVVVLMKYNLSFVPFINYGFAGSSFYKDPTYPSSFTFPYHRAIFSMCERTLDQECERNFGTPVYKFCTALSSVGSDNKIFLLI